METARTPHTRIDLNDVGVIMPADPTHERAQAVLQAVNLPERPVRPRSRPPILAAAFVNDMFPEHPVPKPAARPKPTTMNADTQIGLAG